MEDCIVRERLEDRQLNIISVNIHTEEGCNPMDGEYQIDLISFIGALDLSAVGGVDDISLITDCIENDFDFEKLPQCGFANVILKESGEWEDVFWHKYYTIEKVDIVNI